MFGIVPGEGSNHSISPVQYLPTGTVRNQRKQLVAPSKLLFRHAYNMYDRFKHVPLLTVKNKYI